MQSEAWTVFDSVKEKTDKKEAKGTRPQTKPEETGGGGEGEDKTGVGEMLGLQLSHGFAM